MRAAAVRLREGARPRARLFGSDTEPKTTVSRRRAFCNVVHLPLSTAGGLRVTLSTAASEYSPTCSLVPHAVATGRKLSSELLLRSSAEKEPKHGKEDTEYRIPFAEMLSHFLDRLLDASSNGDLLVDSRAEGGDERAAVTASRSC